MNYKVPFNENDINKLEAGQWVQLTGQLIVMRDAAHKRLLASDNPAGELPIDFNSQIIFYAGPTAGFVNRKGVIGPTTSARMDVFVEPMLKLGVKGFLGKGPRSAEVKDLLVKYGAVYLVTVGGAAALLSKHVKDAKIIAYPDLGPEAIYLITVENFPALIATDKNGKSIF